MRVTPFVVTAIVLFIGLFVNIANGQMLSPNFVPTERIVVLKNGEFLRGRVTITPEQTSVETAQGSRLVLSADQVDFVCDSKVDVYWGKCARTKASDLDGQEAIFYWCLKHKLYDQAQNQITLLAESENLKASTLEFLDRQLNVAIEQAQNKSSIAKSNFPPANDPALKPNVIQPKFAATKPAKPSQKFSLAPIESNDAMKSIGNGELAKREFDFDYNTFRPLPLLGELNRGLVQPALAQPAFDQTTHPMIAKLPANNLNPSNDLNDPSTIRQVGFEQPIEPSSQITIDADGNFTKPGSIDAQLDSTSPGWQPTYPAISIDQRVMSPEIEMKPSTPDHQVPISNAELDQFTRAMPKGTLRPYRSKLEHVLNNGCNAAKCHDSTASVMPLTTRGRNKTIPRRTSQRNLFNTLKYIDRARPFASPLLAAASKPHAGNAEPILAEGSKKFEQLKLWVVMLSDNPESNYQAYLNSKLQPNLIDVSSSEFQSVIPASTDSELLNSQSSTTQSPLTQPSILPIEPDRASLLPVADKIPKTIGEIPELNSSPSTFKPVDPFDPEIFNRKFSDK